MNEVRPHLFQGGVSDLSRDLHDFDLVVLCAREIQPELSRWSWVRRLHTNPGAFLACPMDDCEPANVGDLRNAVRAARLVGERVAEGRRVMTTCAMGWNRSGLVSALTCIALGDSPEVAIRRVRDARGPDALSNRAFVEAIRAQRKRR